MEHQHAVESQAVERYLLGELSSGDREAFEEHFFTCTECAAEIRAGAIFADNAKSVFAEEERKRSRAAERTAGSKGWFAWLSPAFAMPLLAVLLLTSCYQAFILVPSLRQELERTRAARWVPAAVLYAEVRGDEPVVLVPEGAESVLLALDINATQAYREYTVEVRSASGQSLFELTVPASAAAGSLHLLVPARKLEAGSHTLIVRAQQELEIGRYRFQVHRAQSD